MITEIKDLLGNSLNVNDKIAWSEKSSTSTSYLNYGEIIGIEKHNTQTKIIVKVIKRGDDFNYFFNKCFIYPRNYHNIIKIN